MSKFVFRANLTLDSEDIDSALEKLSQLLRDKKVLEHPRVELFSLVPAQFYCIDCGKYFEGYGGEGDEGLLHNDCPNCGMWGRTMEMKKL